MALIPRKTYPELSALTAPVEDADVLAVYRTPGPLRRLTASTFADYIKAFFSASGGSALIGSLLPLTGAVSRTVQDVLADTPNVEGLGVVSNGTSQTSAFVAALNNLDTDNYRGLVTVNPNTRFDVDTVFDAVPTGVMLSGVDTLNWNDGGYSVKLNYVYSGDLVNDDSQFLIGSSYHTVMTLMNRGNAAGSSADGYFCSILHSIGQDLNNNPMPCNIVTFMKDPSSDTWRWALRGQVPYLVAVANPQYWVTGTVYAAGAYCVNSATQFVYRTVAGGTSGASVPTGTGTISDGGVTWIYVQAEVNLDRTMFDFNLETGNFIQYGPDTVKHELISDTQTVRSTLATDGTYTIRHATRSLNIMDVSTASGTVFGIARSPNRLLITTSSFEMPPTGDGRTAYAGTLTECTLPTGCTAGTMSIFFEDSVTTVADYSAGGSANMFLRDGCNVTPAASSVMTFERRNSYGGAWYETSRSFTDIRKGSTASRPTMSSNRGIGYLYLDTTLDADGKPIWWNGSEWVDATGTVV